VRIDHLALPRVGAGRWEPVVPTHPAHVVVSVLDGQRWRVVKEVEFPPDPRISGDGRPHDTSPEEMQELFKAVMAEAYLRIELGGVETDHVRVECDREHPIWQNHGDCATGAAGRAVPFRLLSTLSAHGESLDAAPDTSMYYQPILKLGTIAPRAPRGMKARRHLHSIIFEGRHISVGFSLRRPVLTHLGWDAEGFGQAGRNRVVTRRLDSFLKSTSAASASGPIVRTTAGWTATAHAL
jgi:hypothetical protein